jgi:radical SAM protein with 4Fe4S-binding SPASM domain
VNPEALRAYERGRDIAHQPFRSACYAPFVSMYFHTNGDVVACCKSAHHRLGNITRERLRDIWTGERMAAMRAALREDKFGDACRFCAWQVEGGHEHVHARIYDPLQATDLDDPWPRRMDFTMSNVCNLACVMCYGVLSSTIRAHRDRLPPLPRVYGDAFFDDLRPFLQRLQHTTFMGGEPFLAPENFRVWDMLVEQRLAPRVHVITNGTQWNARIERALDALPMDVSVSVDGVTAATVESVRVHAKFDTVMANVERFRAHAQRNGRRMSLMFCLMRQNWHEFGPYLRLADGMDVDVDLNVVVDPVDCSLFTLPTSELADVIDALDRADATERFGELTRNGRTWRRTLADLRRAATAADRHGGPVPTAPAALDPIAVAWQHVRDGDPSAARRALAAIDELDLADRRYDMLVCRAHAERADGDLPAADATLAEAVAAWDRGAAAFLERGWLRLAQQRGPEAIEAALAARERLAKGRDAGALSQAQRILASGEMLAGRADAAIAALRAIPADDPSAYDIACNEAWFCREARRFAEAEAAVDRARALDPARWQAWLELAWLELARGQAVAARRAADEALQRIAPARRAADAPGVLVARVAALRAAGELADARASADELLALRPGDAWATTQRQEIEALAAERAQQSPLCIAAASALLIDVDKGVRPCCDYWGSHRPGSPSVGQLGEASLPTIVAGPTWSSIKSDLAAQRVPAGCRDCIAREKATGSSHRLLLERLRSPRWRDGLTYLELNSSNLCNLQCRHCNPMFSSRWAAHERRHGRAATAVVSPDPELLLANLRAVDLRHLAYVSLKGGEPMINADVPALLSHLDAIGVLAQVTVFVVTNGTTVSPAVAALLAKAREVAVCVSVDGFGAVQTYVRHGGSDIATIEKSIAVWAAMPNVVLDRNTAVMAYNVHDLPRIDAWWAGLPARFPGRYRPSHYESFVLSPAELAVHCLQDGTREQLARRLEALDPSLYAPVMAVLRQPFAGAAMHDAFVRRTMRDDAELGRNVLDAAPELADEMTLLGEA